jgi:hypothetical protein
VGCGACCVAPSISSVIPGMPGGKPAGERCVQLTADNRCRLFGLPERPAVCVNLRPAPDICGDSAAEALALLARMEISTLP